MPRVSCTQSALTCHLPATDLQRAPKKSPDPPLAMESRVGTEWAGSIGVGSDVRSSRMACRVCLATMSDYVASRSPSRRRRTSVRS